MTEKFAAILDSGFEPLSIYIHYPFCKAKCPYCDFNSHVSKSATEANRDFLLNFTSGYKKELEFFGEILGKREIKSIFFGGGTPSLMPAWMVAEILEKIAAIWPIAKSCEISLEANPTSAESQKFYELKNCGINRISLGIQALNDSDLKFLGRKHCAKEAISAISQASKHFENFSFDLIYARPNQTLKSWQAELKQALSLEPKHLSLYQLTIEKGTKFFSQYAKKEFILPDEELSADLLEETNKIMAEQGFDNYEISNFAKPGFACYHNLGYWRGQEYLGIGAGAHSRLFLDDKSAAKIHQNLKAGFDRPNLESSDLKNDNQALTKEASRDLCFKKIVNFKNQKVAKKTEKYALMTIHEPLNWLAKVQKFSQGTQIFNKLSQQEIAEELIIMGLRIADGVCEEAFLRQIWRGFNKTFDDKKLQFLIDSGLLRKEKVADKGKSGTKLKIPKSKILLTDFVIKKLCDAIFLR